MKKTLFRYIDLCVVLASVSLHAQVNITQTDAGKIFQVTIRDDTFLFDRAEYAVFIPENIETIKGVFIHQHGCTMEGRGLSSAYDIQYQVLAKKWGLAVIGPDLYPKQRRNCFDWIEPESGSAQALLKAMEIVGKTSGHMELKDAPWLLWGHSGGGYWTLAMMRDYPERIIAAFVYSPAFNPRWDFPLASAKVPLMIRHAGKDDINDSVVNCWETAVNTFGKLRKMNGYASIAYTAGQDHNFSYVRYMAIPFYESVMEQRLPDSPSDKLKDMDQSRVWLGDTASYHIMPASICKGNVNTMNWLPDSIIAMKWREYVITGTIIDKTPPPAPYELQVNLVNDTIAVIKWKADADIESGIQYFNIKIKDGQSKRFPDAGHYQRFDTNGDDTVPTNLPELACEITKPACVKESIVFVNAVNHAGLESSFSDIYIIWP